MANEYLRRTPTSTGNRKVWTWSGWVKRNKLGVSQYIINRVFLSSSNFELYFTTSDTIEIADYTSGYNLRLITTQTFRDVSSWYHILLVIDTTSSIANDRVKLFVNGNRITNFGTQTTPSINLNTQWNNTQEHQFSDNGPYDNFAELTDIFFIDGQALTPDVFGFYKVGKGYISAGSTQSTDFRPGQWVPKTPRVIKTAINNNGGFGVNGFYLPMNDSNNFGADFHCEPNSIIKLQENLPQPRCRIDGVGDYTGALRDDPFKQYLVLALPFVSGGLSSGFGDYSAAIKGSGSAKTLTNTTAVSIATTAGYYGSAANFGGSHYLTASYNSDFNFGTGDFTVEMWIYPTAVSDIRGLFAVSGGSGGNPKMVFHLNSGTPSVHYNGLTNASDIYTAASSAIPANQWTHLAYVRKGTTWTWFANGVATGTGSNTTVITFTTQPYYIGYGGEGYFAQFNGYLQDLRIYKGVAKYKGGFDVPRPYTPVGIATWRAVPDTTANNFATLNPLEQTNGLTTLTFSEGNNRIIFGGSSYNPVYSTVGVTTGKYYFECRFNTQYVSPGIGGNNTNPIVRVDNGGIYLNEVSQQSGLTSQASGQIFGIALDRTNSSVQFYLNGSTFGSSQSFSANSGQEIFARIMSQNAGASSDSVWNFGQNPTFSGNTTAGTYTDSNGKGLFKYQPPSGFLALCEDNLPTPAISDPGKHFKTVLYTGDSNASRSITGVGFTPDLVWAKQRDEARYHSIYDSVRGSNLLLRSDNTSGDVDAASTGLNSFDSDGFGVGIDNGINKANQQYVAWCWRAGAGTTSTNTNGSITSVVSVNQDAGFSIVSYTGSGANSTVGHGLGRAPAMYITKGRAGAVGATNWNVYHKALGPDKYLQLNSTNAAGTSTTLWQNTNPTSSVFYLSSSSGDTNGSGSTYIAYCWAEIEGYSKFGSYTGNGSTDGPFCYCGFRPAWVMIKNISGSHNWEIYDSSMNPINPVGLTLLPNASDAQIDTTPRLDFLSNGFKWRNIGGSVNGSGNTIIFAAFAESPFQTANSK